MVETSHPDNRITGLREIPFLGHIWILRDEPRVSFEQCSFHPGWLFDIWDDYTTQLCGDYFISQYKDPVINQSVFHGMSAKGLVKPLLAGKGIQTGWNDRVLS